MADLTRLLSRGELVAGSKGYFAQSWVLYALSAAFAYPFLVASLRYRRIRTSESKHPYPTRESYASMTDDEAFEMINQMAELEFPTFFEKALQFALFRVRNASPSNWANSSTHTAYRPTGSQLSVLCLSEPHSSRPQAQRESAMPTLGFWWWRSGATSPLTSVRLQPLPGLTTSMATTLKRDSSRMTTCCTR